ncbi:MAG: MerR family transcriptional regulator [Armatimonadetes bacterium]|nr:MerR family transcriptional regulator [Armatimonadota bacterium]NIM24229.1 MerR family transcriptional regulator [Armatimonadota bacterium]NIM68098.1 MerR family transcriptional regulator [Armatimonadota bacterium]NIM76560.1 MerR family transcriptional regulator [Armatimonadota bacterium]NIN06303.1 MerR family transcriptional regulator [Armatimonadota bacterium]
MREPTADEPVYIISIAARLVGMHPQSLRLYERKGLIRPARLGKKRLYSERDIQRLRHIQQLTQDRSVNLAGVRVVFELLEKMEALRSQMEARMEALEAELREAEAAE